MNDIWHFYRSERLYTLRVIKEILSNLSNEDHKHQSTFVDIFNQMQELNLMPSLLDQLEHVTNEKNNIPELSSPWSHFNLREQSELTQILLLYFEHTTDILSVEHFKRIWSLVTNHKFGSRNDQGELAESIGQLESVLIVKLISILDNDSAKSHPIWSDEKEIKQVDTMVASSLGNVEAHGPIMIAWMLSHFVKEGESSLPKYKCLGERAVQLNVIKYLIKTMKNEVVCKVVAHAVHTIVYGIITTLLDSFDSEIMGLSEDIHELVRLLLMQEDVEFWDQTSSGLRSLFDTRLAHFPAESKSVLQLCNSLASGSYSSADEVLKVMQNLKTFAEPIEDVPSHEVAQDYDGRLKALTTRTPSSCQTLNFHIPAGTTATASQRYYFWRLDYNGLKYMFGELDVAINQVSMGVKNLSPDKLDNVGRIMELMKNLLLHSPQAQQVIGHFVSKASFILVEKFSHVQNPPIDLLATCISSLSIVAKRKPLPIWERLSETGIFPYITKSHLASQSSNINPGLVGDLLAQQECVRGEYPLTDAFLELLLACVRKQPKTDSAIHPATPSLLYIIHDVLPAFQNWGFNRPGHREKFGQKIMMVCLKILRESESKHLKDVVLESLMSPAPNQTLIDIVSTGDRNIQSLSLAQTNVERGTGVELSKLVNLSLQTLNILLDSCSGIAEGLKNIICSTSGGNFLITIAHYIYHLQSCDVPVAAVNVLTTVAKLFPMSLLACFGSDAEAVKEIFISRLESKTEDVLLKIAIIKFFSACVDAQPGLIQLLLDAKDNVMIENVNKSSANKKDLSDKEKEENDGVLIGDSGCLNSIVEILNDLKDRKSDADEHADALHIAVIDFAYNLWIHQRIMAVAYLKKQPEFWTNLTQPLFDKQFARKPKLNGCILRIISSEIYTYRGKVDKSLASLLENFFDENQTYLRDWCELVVNQLPSSCSLDVSVLSTSPSMPTNDDEEVIFLLGAWKTFLIVASKDMPVSITPTQCNLTVACLIKAIRKQLTAETPSPKITTGLSETCLVLMQKWQTKCAPKNMEGFCREQADMLSEMSISTLPFRAKAAILAIASTALKFSAFKMDHEAEVLSSWLTPISDLIQQNDFRDSQVPILELGLLRNILVRFQEQKDFGSEIWFPILHNQALIQTVLSIAHHAIRHKERPELINAASGVLLTIAKSKTGCHAILNNDLTQLLWLPLSNIHQANKDWIPVFSLVLHVATTVQRVGGQSALDTSISFVAMLQNQLISFLLSPKDTVQSQHIDLTSATASFVGLLFVHYKQWQLQHPASMGHFYQAMCQLMHICAALLIRPSVLRLLISQQNAKNEEAEMDYMDKVQRARRLSTAGSVSSDSPDELTNPEMTTIQNKLLDIISSTLSMLSSLSPKLTALLTHDLIDLEAYPILLQIGFSTPAFEQVKFDLVYKEIWYFWSNYYFNQLLLKLY